MAKSGKIIITILLFSVCDVLTASLFQDVLHTPFFFDTIFMMAALFLFGPVAAFFEYLCFIGIICIKLQMLYGDTEFIYFYVLSAVTIILATWLFVRKTENLRKGVNQTFLYLLTAETVAGVACSLVSGCISYVTYSMNEIDWDFNKVIFAFSGDHFDILTSAIVGRIPVIVLDRIITTFAGFGISRLYGRIV